jgi:hypothetical protein
MVKVKCISCGLIGYTASPRFIVCVCGGKFKEILKRQSRLEILFREIEGFRKD